MRRREGGQNKEIKGCVEEDKSLGKGHEAKEQKRKEGDEAGRGL